MVNSLDKKQIYAIHTTIDGRLKFMHYLFLTSVFQASNLLRKAVIALTFSFSPVTTRLIDKF
ncbi:hypothetical protein GCM10022218_14100 [Sphingobacterium ginsenosidimutans]|uniref:Uncharacterized protein n=1 Tax=Sphingobacterium ginsenosidimutans TaxID=687845 RepID=A0ABP7ZXJ6_9SPHI